MALDEEAGEEGGGMPEPPSFHDVWNGFSVWFLASFSLIVEAHCVLHFRLLDSHNEVSDYLLSASLPEIAVYIQRFPLDYLRGPERVPYAAFNHFHLFGDQNLFVFLFLFFFVHKLYFVIQMLFLVIFESLYDALPSIYLHL